MKTISCIVACLVGVISFHAKASQPVEVPADHCTPHSQWEGMKVGVLGDSMSDPNLSATTKRFYNYLSDLMGILPFPYATSGFQWKDLPGKISKMKEDHPDGDIDAIFIWCGTNDFNSSRPIGEFFTESVETVNVNGTEEQRRKRSMVMDESTFCGSINMVMADLKDNFPTTQIIILTPIHRGFATFGSTNVQPSEEYANGVGLYIDDYVHALKRAGEVWAVPVIDLYSISGLYPLSASHDRYIANPSTDRLHPDDAGHYRLARTLQTQLLSFPPTF